MFGIREGLLRCFELCSSKADALHVKLATCFPRWDQHPYTSSIGISARSSECLSDSGLHDWYCCAGSRFACISAWAEATDLAIYEARRYCCIVMATGSVVHISGPTGTTADTVRSRSCKGRLAVVSSILALSAISWYCSDCSDALQADPWYQRLRIEWDLLMHLRLEFSLISKEP